MRIDYDPEKDVANRVKHGVGLAFGARVFEDEDVAIIPTLREEDEERSLQGGRHGGWELMDRGSRVAWRRGQVRVGQEEQRR